jgi:hypothetical protein
MTFRTMLEEDMADDPIPADIRDFIQRHIDSVAQLEALLLMRSNLDKSWDVAATAKRLYASEQEIAGVLERLCTDGLLDCKDGTYRYECASEVQEKIDRLATAYSRHLIPVTTMIHAKTSRIREFADAFKFRKER